MSRLIAAGLALGLASLALAQEVQVHEFNSGEQSATAQDQEEVSFCHRQEDGTCRWVRQMVPVGPVNMPAPPRDVVASIEWKLSQPSADPSISWPGTCARRADFARYRFAAAVASGDLNAVVSVYNWKGRAEGQVDGIVARFSGLPTFGNWEHSYVSSSLGDEELARKVKRHWRWTGGGSPLYLDMVNIQGCWFVEFGKDPGDTVRLTVPSGRLQETEPGVYEF